MYPTAEVRWFVPGPLPGAARQWFEATGDGPAPPQLRDDLYLLALTPDAPNVKLRGVQAGGEQRMEVKARTGALGAQTFGAGAVGRVGQWQKWRFPLADGAPAPDLLGDAAHWLRVAKRRRSRLFTVENGAVVEQPGDDRPASGCDLELSEIRAGHARFWSICFEAFGPSSGDGLTDLLAQTATHALACGTPPRLTADRSMSYPEWLARIGKPPGAL